MVAVAFALLWAGYSGGLWGWCLLRGYNVTLGQLVSPVHPYGQGKGQGWPPAHIPDTQVWPDGKGGGGNLLAGGVVSPGTAQQIQQAAQNALNPQQKVVVPAPGNPTAIFPKIS